MYKFVGEAECLPSIAAGVLKFTLPADLNDPAEMLPDVSPQAVRQSLALYRDRGYSQQDLAALHRQQALLRQLAPEFIAVETPSTVERANALIRSPFYDDTDRLKTMLEKVTEVIASGIAVCSLTRRYDSLPMWAHYATRAKGAVVEYGCLEEAFPKEPSNIFGRAIAMQYGGDGVGVTFDPNSHETLFARKFKDWSYEEEVRYIVPATSCRREVCNGKAILVYDISPRHIVRICFGWQTPEETRLQVSDRIRAANPDVRIGRAEFRGGKVHLIG